MEGNGNDDEIARQLVDLFEPLGMMPGT